MEQAKRVPYHLDGAADRVMCRRNVVALHELLGKGLAGFQTCCALGRTEDAPPAPVEFIHNSKRQRMFRSYHGEFWLEAISELHQRIKAASVDGNALALFGDSGIAGRADYFGDAR